MKSHTKMIVALGLTFLIAACSAKGEKEVEEEYLLVYTSQAFFYDGEHLVIDGTSPAVTFFSDRPVRKAGRLPLEEAFAWGHASFLENPPNASLAFLEGDRVDNVIMTISDGVLKGDSISLNVNILEGQLPKQGGHNSLFVDGLGLGLGGDGLLGGVRDMVSDVVSDEVSDTLGIGDDEEDEGADEEDTEEDDAPPASSIVEELTQLKSLLDAGLITQEDYDTKKKEALDKL